MKQPAHTKIEKVIKREGFITWGGLVMFYMVILLKAIRSLFPIYIKPKPLYAIPCTKHGYWSGFG